MNLFCAVSRFVCCCCFFQQDKPGSRNIFLLISANVSSYGDGQTPARIICIEKTVEGIPTLAMSCIFLRNQIKERRNPMEDVVSRGLFNRLDHLTLSVS
jgi:hypothetical protein